MLDRIGRIPELAGPAQQCVPAPACIASAAPGELIDDQAPWHYDSLRIVRKPAWV